METNNINLLSTFCNSTVSTDIIEKFLEYLQIASPVWREDSFELYFDEKDEYFESILHLGSLEFSLFDKLGVFAIKIGEGKELTERSSKLRQFEFAKRILKDNDAYMLTGGLFLFYDNCGNKRLSFIDVQVTEQKKLKYNTYRRFTFYISPLLTNKTFITQLAGVKLTSKQELRQAFSVEPLTKSFYEEISTWFYANVKKVYFPNNDNEKNLIRLITRLIFVWFLKQKGLIPHKLFDPIELKNIVKDFMKATNYYNAILQNLFFATLNQPMGQRKFVDGDEKNYFNNRNTYGVKNLYRYKNLFLISEQEVLKLFADIPFLNGGLFDCLDKEDENYKVVYIDGFTRNASKRAKIEDKVFFNSDEEIVDLSEYGLGKRKTRGLIDILNSYNFTTDENTPIDQEIALDPEMLGKIFENLLAAYVPETSVNARKATGSYYTPREIVDFMIDASLLEYFSSKLHDVDRHEIELLLSYADYNVDLTAEQKRKIVQSIDQIKVLDPACGSGAFLMGVLHKLVHLLQKVDPYNNIWKDIQKQKATQKISEARKSQTSVTSYKKIQKQKATQKIAEAFDYTYDMREKMPQEINEIFEQSTNDYCRKLYLIENCIYGVDIQEIAVQIAKLRFFISLVIEQQINSNLPNLGIRSLPNLETKIVAADTLVSLGVIPDNLFKTKKIQNLEKEIENLRHKYFTASTRQQKIQYQLKDKELRNKLKDVLKEIGFPNQTSEKIVNLDLYDQTKSYDWFDPSWFFGITDGFDIVIGNPPYISTKGVSENSKKILTSLYGFADDTYNHFFFKGLEILKPNGILAYISSKTFWTIQTKRNLRELLLSNKILQIVDTANPFAAAMVDTCITIVKKNKPEPSHKIKFLDAKDNFLDLANYEVQQSVFENAPNMVFFIPTQNNIDIYDRFGKKVKELLEVWWDKISTSKNIEKYKKELEAYRKNLKPGDITLLGLITEGGVGIQTGNNGKYIGVLDGTKWADKVRRERPEKLLLAEKFCNEKVIKNKNDAEAFLNKLTEKEIRKLFDDLKEKYGRDIFGQGWLYRIVSPDEIANVDALTDDEKLNGIAGEKTFVPYDKGDKDGNRWYAPTPYYIDWSKQNVSLLQTDTKARWQGYQFYFREGFCWSFALLPQKEESMYIKCRIKEKSINDVMSMAMYSISKNVSNKYLIAIINSKFFYNYLKIFINSTAGQQLNDFRQLPIIIPTEEQLQQFEAIFDRAYNIQKQKFDGKLSQAEADKQLAVVQKDLDEMVEKMYLGGKM